MSALGFKQVDMTRGSILSAIVSFSIPLLIGSLLQTLYNTVDSLVIGNFVGKDVLAAVGACYSPMLLLLSVMLGISGGVSVLVSQVFGSGDEKKLRDVVATANGFFVLSVVPITVIALLMVEPLLEIINIPGSSRDHASLYLYIIFGGLICHYGYNLNSGLLRGLGDSRSPLLFLLVACIVNVVLDLVFVLVFKWDVFGVAVATIIAQCVSWVYSISHIKRHFPHLGHRLFSVRIDRGHLKQMISLSVPITMNHAFFSLGFLLYYRFVNGFGPDFMAGYTIAGKVEGLTWLPMASLGMAATTFAGQNFGAGNMEWINRGVRLLLKSAILINVATAVVSLVFGHRILGLFSPDNAVVNAGYMYLSCTMPFYWMYAVIHILSSFMNGVGSVRFPAAVTMIMFWVVRLPLAWYLSRNFPETVLHYAFPASWVVALALTVGFFLTGRWKRRIPAPASIDRGDDEPPRYAIRPADEAA
ncbi:MAG: MATE family efflux transporter [Planctomycetes bacterium]|nr:MATE family efflux transporter [Planctomycetota bacterium]